MKTPNVSPIIVVSANPFSNPAPANISGSIAAVVVKNATIMIKNAL